MCKCNCCGHAEVLDQSEDYRRWFALTNMPLDAPVRWREFLTKTALNKDNVEIGEATAPWTARLTQRKT